MGLAVLIGSRRSRKLNGRGAVGSRLDHDAESLGGGVVGDGPEHPAEGQYLGLIRRIAENGAARFTARESYCETVSYTHLTLPTNREV